VVEGNLNAVNIIQTPLRRPF